MYVSTLLCNTFIFDEIINLTLFFVVITSEIDGNSSLIAEAPTATTTANVRTIYDNTTMPLHHNVIESYSPILSEVSSVLSDTSAEQTQGDTLGLPFSHTRNRWAPQQQRQLLQAIARSFVNSHGKTETDIF